MVIEDLPGSNLTKKFSYIEISHQFHYLLLFHQTLPEAGARQHYHFHDSDLILITLECDGRIFHNWCFSLGTELNVLHQFSSVVYHRSASEL